MYCCRNCKNKKVVKGSFMGSYEYRCWVSGGEKDNGQMVCDAYEKDPDAEILEKA